MPEQVSSVLNSEGVEEGGKVPYVIGRSKGSDGMGWANRAWEGHH